MNSNNMGHIWAAHILPPCCYIRSLLGTCRRSERRPYTISCLESKFVSTNRSTCDPFKSVARIIFFLLRNIFSIVPETTKKLLQQKKNYSALCDDLTASHTRDS